MKSSCDKALILITSLVNSVINLTFAPELIQQSALPPVLSVECGLFA
jgi:hypothetical protein